MTSLGRYRIGARLGTGGSAEVFAAELTDGGGRPLVIKRLRRELAGRAEIAALFDAELRIVRRLHHGAIVQLFEHGVDGAGAPYLVMERVDGIALDGLLAHLAATGGRLAVGDAVQIAIDACGALDYAHRATDEHGAPLGVVHRDVSPRNLLLSREGLVKLTDFGIARFTRHDAVTLPGTVKGSIGYLSPEQLRGEPLDGRSDQFALGVVLWEMLAGHNPLAQAESLDDAAARLEIGLPTLPVGGDLDEALAAIAGRATAGRAAERFATTDQLGHALDEWRVARRLRVDRARLGAQVRAAIGEPAAAIRALDGAVDAALPGVAATALAPATGRRDRPRAGRRAAVVLALAAAAALTWWLARDCGREPAPAPAPIAADDASIIDGAAADAGLVDAGVPDAASVSPRADAARPRPRLPEATGRGHLEINLVPWADVIVDGRAAGTTPIDLEVAAGARRVELRNPTTGRHKTVTVEVPAGGTVEITSW